MRIRKRGNLLIIVTFLSCIAAVSTNSDPCLDGVNEDASLLHLPSQYANLTPPWQRADGKLAKVTRSEGLTYHWSWMKSLQLTGFSKTVEDVIVFLTESQCLFVPVGPFVRSALLGQKSVYISGEVSCELHELYNKCVSKFGATGCSLYPIEDGNWGSYRLEIGDATSNRSTFAVKAEPIVLHEWRSLIGAPRDKWRFTIDALAMFDDGAGDLFVIDPTGEGYKHVCEKKLSPASDDWEKWSKNQPLKMMGFYDLRSGGFSPKNESLQKFVNEKIKVSEKRIAQQFYCEHVLKGVSNLEGQTPVCHTTYPEKEAAKKIAQMRNLMIKEMGNIWNSSIGKAAEDLEAVFNTARQFVDVRARLLHKVTSSHDSKIVSEEPKIIEEGRPMINDSAQVHARPILDMAAQAPELPPEYPSAPRAQPNERLEFVEPPHLQVEGAGMDPTAIEANGSDEALELMDDDLEEQEEIRDAKRNEGGFPAEEAKEADFTHHNSVNGDLPVMRFDKVEENGLSDAAASAMEISTSSDSNRGSFVSVFMPLAVIAFHALI